MSQSYISNYDLPTRLQGTDHVQKPKARGNAKHGERMIEVRVRFWTNDIAKRKGAIMPRHAWDSGVLAVLQNAAHGISGTNPKPFNSLLDLSPVLAEMLMRQRITLHTGRKLKSLIKDAPARSKR